ncbi:hypothetical protein A6M21_15230 [Desulfotomaculum copahuensis]|uniref:PIN domain-containing protein n=1 Tax=Desulfotomaculum copahuensis TaxID=1838280 RepID=A0A1B7LBF7_9FIRM|nr:hypothetical protein A6M21_15230 [Desulfotomaculum copahuensis]
MLEDRVLLAPPVMAELLSGTVNEKEFNELKKDLAALPLLGRHEEVWDYAAGLNFNLRRRGVNIPLIDTLIASWAILHGCILVHHDHHYDLIKTVATDLRTIAVPLFGN